uniref:Reverse transcriptase domain-containing protein n=1 Tax=Cannabis sativa TaxID=3483 RepID=A0A803PWX2_CANSA
MVNSRWSYAMPDSEAVFLPELTFDHSPILVSIYRDWCSGKKPFRYYNMWKLAPNFDTKVRQCWQGDVNGTKMFKVVSKLKRLKPTLKQINQEGFSEIQKADLMAKNELIAAQDALTKNPSSLQLMEAEQEVTRRYKEIHKAYSMFLSQKAKINWASFGDENLAFFHASLKSRRMQNKIFSIEDEQGTWFDSPDGVQQAFLSYYEKLLGTNYTSQEVKDALFSIPGIKAPGPDGFGSAFYQDNWDTVGTDFTEAILSFLNTGKILKEINHTTITLIPKIACPKNVADFRPISCCNVLYKTATKVLCNRLRRVLPDLIAENQGGFVHGRYIAHNVLVCQDMVRLYGRKSCKPSCMIKIDLRKAYDTIEWSFLEEMLAGFGFPVQFIELRGLRQGDPMSPLLFVLGMEYLSRILRKIGEMPGFKFHDRCSSLKLNHMCFADDLLIFSHGDFISAMLMLRGLKLFSSTSGLMPNEQKTAIYCSGMPDAEVGRILDASQFNRSSLPFRYLDIPICSKKISHSECQILLEKMVSKIRGWSSRNLSYMGRVTLINAVLIAIHTYWAQIMILPKKLLKDIEAICRSYLWKGTQMMMGPGLVAWEHVCAPKNTGGLGLRDIQKWNTAAMTRYVWDIASKKDCLFVRWIHNVYLKDSCWWDYEAPTDCSWFWKKLVGVKNQVKAKVDRRTFSMQKFSISNTYHLLFIRPEKKDWCKHVWDRLVIPKHKFILWLVLLDRLKTKDRVCRYDPQVDPTCLLCGKADESVQHLFFQCEYSSKCLAEWKSRLSWGTKAIEVHRLLQLISKFKGISVTRRSMMLTMLTALIYQIWGARNDVLWNQKLWQTRIIVDRVQQESKRRIVGVWPSKTKEKDKNWVLNL